MEKDNLRNILKREMELRGFKTHTEFAEFLGISRSFLSEIFAGKRSGERSIPKFARRLGFSEAYLKGEALKVPVVSYITFHEHGIGASLIKKGPLEYVDLSSMPGAYGISADQYYALRVKGQILIPICKDGDLLIVEKGSGHKVTHGDKVIYQDQEIFYFKIAEEVDGRLHLRCLRPDIPIIHGDDPSRFDKVMFILIS